MEKQRKKLFYDILKGTQPFKGIYDRFALREVMTSGGTLILYSQQIVEDDFSPPLIF